MRLFGKSLVVLGTAAAATAGTVLLLPGSTPPAAAAGLTPYSSCDQLLTHYRASLRESASPWGIGGGGWGYGVMETSRLAAGGAVAAPMPATAQGVAGSAAGAGDSGSWTGGTGGGLDAVGSGETGTNVQEKGVDEPDSAKIVGDRIVTVTGTDLRVVRAGAQPELLSTTGLLPGSDDAADRQAYWGGGPAEVLLSGSRAVVLLPGFDQPNGSQPAYRSWYGGTPKTDVVLVDLESSATPTVLERMSLDGSYLSARLANGRIRLVTRSTPMVEGTTPKGQGTEVQQDESLAENLKRAGQATLAEVLPRRVRTSADGRVLSDSRAVECDEVARAEEPHGASTLLVTTLDPGRGLTPLDSTGVTTDGDLLYATAGRLYVATSRWGTAAPSQPVDATASTVAEEQDSVTTEVHAFDTTTDETRYVGTGSVPGYVLGRWALSEHQGRLRVAVTSSPPWQAQEQTISSLHVLEESGGELVPVGRVSGMGKGERIQAVRFFGDLATVVTFRQTDPLYVLDLSDPADPRITGELKIPGFSTYLHPLGGDLLLGLGMDADEKTGQVTGVQLSTFDLSDRTAPRQVDRLSLGQGHSQALQDSRAFGYDPSRRTAVLPFQVYDGRANASSALGVRIAADGTLSEAGRLVVAPDELAERVLHDADHVYAVNANGIAAGDADDLTRTGNVGWR